MKRIDRTELEELMDRGASFVLLEVLHRESFRSFHIPGAINVPLGEDFEERIQEAVPDKRTTIVVYCMDPECPASPTAARKLDALGYENVMNYEGGKEDWRHSGHHVDAAE